MCEQEVVTCALERRGRTEEMADLELGYKKSAELEDLAPSSERTVWAVRYLYVFHASGIPRTLAVFGKWRPPRIAFTVPGWRFLGLCTGIR